MIKAALHHTVIAIRRYANRLIHIPLPSLVTGTNHIKSVTDLLSSQQKKQVMIVTDQHLVLLGLVQPLLNSLESQQIRYTLFDQVSPDPTIEVVELGCQAYIQSKCDAIVAFGGGSVIDCTKAIAAVVTKHKPIKKLAGLFKIRQKLPYFIAVPTTAGTGSEATLVAVITDQKAQKKFTVIDPCLVPNVALLDPFLMKGLPPKITAETGIDALTHAIESYIGKHAYPITKQYAISAMEKIFKFLPLAYDDGNNETARAEMAIASFYAGAAFTRTSVGYVHAIAHQLGGVYKVPHGLANAIVLPHILDFSLPGAATKFAELAKVLHMVDLNADQQLAANTFVTRVKCLLVRLNIQTDVPQMQANDISMLAERAVQEAYCDYPVPRLMNKLQCENILQTLLPASR